MALALAAALAGCAETPTQRGTDAASRPASIPISEFLKRPADYYTDDGPDGAPPVDLDRLADATPMAEPLHATANDPYTVFGRDYVPMKALAPYKRQGTASWYGRKFHGQRTASGEIYDMYAMTASHPTLAIPSFARVTNLANRRSVIVRINDRGPFASGRIMDVSYAAAHRLGFAASGSAQVEVEAVLPADQAIAALPERPAPAPASPAPVQEPEPGVPVSAEHSGIYLQLGAFSVRANAENFRARLASRVETIGAPLTIAQRANLHRVQLGPFRDRAEANAAAKRLRELLELKSVLVAR